MDQLTKVIATEDGSHSLYSERFTQCYHSRYGAIQESQHVFIQTGLVPVLEIKPAVRVFEMGFGTGLNAYLSWQYAHAQQKAVYFETVEAYPLPLEQVELLNYPEMLGGKATDFLALHEAAWNRPMEISPEFTLCKWSAKIEDATLSGGFDVVYFDAFAPSSQPALWETPVLEKIYQAMAPGGVFVTYCAKGVVKRRLRSVGFTVEGVPGPPGKREMIRASKDH